MPGANCALYGCGTSRRSNLSLFKIPFPARGDGDEITKLKSAARTEWLRVILRTREKRPELKKRIDANNIFSSEFQPRVYEWHDTHQVLADYTLASIAMLFRDESKSIDVKPCCN